MSEYYVEQTSGKLDGYGVDFFEQNVEPDSVGAHAHIHDAIEVICIESGNYQIFVNGREFAANPGDLFLFRANAIHSIYAKCAPQNRYYVLKVRPSVLFELASEKNAVNYVLHFVVSDDRGKVCWTAKELENGHMNRALERLRECFAGTYPCQDILLKICSYEVLYALLCDMTSQQEYVENADRANDTAAAQIYKAIRHINQNFHMELDARMLSRMVNMSYSYFSRSFKKITGRSFKEYLNEVRINRAEHLLMTTDMSVTRVALECGYNNVSYFITVYKTLKNKTPLSNRKIGIEEG